MNIRSPKLTKPNKKIAEVSVTNRIKPFKANKRQNPLIAKDTEIDIRLLP
jgi:hypothetical protein